MQANHAACVRQLYREYDDILYHFGLPRMHAVLHIAPLTRHWGRWDPHTRSITLATQLIEGHGWDVVVEVLKHEMAHQWVQMHAPDAAPHGRAFADACCRLGMAPWAAACSGALPMSCLPGAHRAVSGEEQRLLDKVEKLLTLAGSSNEHEAGLAMRRAREILTRYNLTRTQAPKKDDMTYAVVHRSRRRTCRIESMVVALLVEHFHVRAVHTTLFDAERLCDFRAVELLGEHRHVALAEYVYYFLLRTVQDLYERYKGEQPGAGSRRQAYMIGVLLGFGENLAAHAAEPGPALDARHRALVRMTEQQLEAYVRSRHPGLRNLRMRRGRLDAGAVHAGKQAGRAIVLHRAVSGQTLRRGRLLQAPRC